MVNFPFPAAIMKLLVWSLAVCACLAFVGAQDMFQDGTQDGTQDVAPTALDGDVAKQIEEELARREEIQDEDGETGSETQLQCGEDVIAKSKEEIEKDIGEPVEFDRKMLPN